MQQGKHKETLDRSPLKMIWSALSGYRKQLTVLTKDTSMSTHCIVGHV